MCEWRGGEFLQASQVPARQGERNWGGYERVGESLRERERRGDKQRDVWVPARYRRHHLSAQRTVFYYITQDRRRAGPDYLSSAYEYTTLLVKGQ